METYSSCCVQGSAGFWSSYRLLTDPEDSLSEVVYNWVAGGKKDGGAVYSTVRTLPAAAPTAARCGEDRALCIVTNHYHHNNNYHPWAAAVCPGGRDKFHCSLESVRVPTLLCKPKCQSIMF